MRTLGSVFLKVIALLLVFLLGFLACIGAIVGAGYYVYTGVSIDAIEKLTGAEIDTEKIFESEKAEVNIEALTLAELIEEIILLGELGDELSLNTLVERYALVLSEGLDNLIPDNVKAMSIKKIFSSEGIDEIMKTVSIGNLLKYEKVNNPSYTPGGEEDEFIWKDTDGNEVVGINALIADYTLYKLMNDGVDTEMIINELTIAEVLLLTEKSGLPVYIVDGNNKTDVSDTLSVSIWVQNDGYLATSVISAIADSKVADVGQSFDGLNISDVIGYVEYDGKYYSKELVNDNGEEYVKLTLEEGLTAEIADVSVGGISGGELNDEIDTIAIATILGYKEIDGEWYSKYDAENPDNNVKVTGIMAAIADDKIGEIGSTVGQIAIGEVAGYTLGEDGKWYSEYDAENPDNNVEASGILGALAELTVDQMTDEEVLSGKIQTVEVSDALGYEYHGGKWYSEYYGESSDDNVEVTGFMAVIAASALNNIQADVDKTDMGELLGFTGTEDTSKPIYAEDGTTVIGYEKNWLDKEDQPVHVLMNKVSNTKFENLGTITDDLTLADIIPAEQRTTGFIQLLDEDTTLDGIAKEVNDVFNETKLSTLVEKNIIKFTGEKAEQYKQIFTDVNLEFYNMTLEDLFVWVAEKALESN